MNEHNHHMHQPDHDEQMHHDAPKETHPAGDTHSDDSAPMGHESNSSAHQHMGHEMPPETPGEHAGHMEEMVPPMDMANHGSMQHSEHSAHEGHAAQMEHMVHEGHEIQAGPNDHAGHGEHEGHGVSHLGHEQMFRRRFWVSLVLSIPVLLFSHGLQVLLGYTMPAFPGSQWIAPLFSVIVFAYGGLPFLRMAVPELQNRQPGMMTLISLAISVAFLYSLASLFMPGQMDFFWELVTLIDIMLLGHWIEMRSVRQASGALDALAKLMPDTAERVGADGQVTTVAVSALAQGDLVLVRPGSSIPADGEVMEGESAVNESMITGESKPVSKQAGEKVVGGSINGDGSLRVRVTATGSQTALAGIMRLVEQAQQSKSRTQVLADKAAGWLFYVALGAAAITAVAWTIGVGFNVQVIERVATVLVIACPHALGLAIPLVVAITTAMGANNGILVRDRLQMEAARDIQTVIFDKTGTLTEGRFGVVAIETAGGYSADDALALTAAVEGDSEHTIAQGIRRSAAEKGLQMPEIHDFEAIKGRGIHARVDGRDVYVGGPRLLEMLLIQLPEPLARFEQAASAKGQSVVHLVEDRGGDGGRVVVASLALADVIRPESREAVQRLHEMGVQVAMLTGDSEAVAKAVAQELGIDTYFAQVLPENKDQKVVALQQKGQRVAMVGDGVNDAPALTRADVGIAIGSGTDVAVESAGVILVKSNPLDVVKIIELSRASYRKMIQNLVWAAGYNVVAIPLAAGVLAPWGILLSPAVGALLMSLSTVIVAINAQLLRAQRL
ncbi:MAG TPA: copper-translocating P-type ATPase [Anaerolineaceae bacterium]